MEPLWTNNNRRGIFDRGKYLNFQRRINYEVYNLSLCCFHKFTSSYNVKGEGLRGVELGLCTSLLVLPMTPR